MELKIIKSNWNNDSLESRIILKNDTNNTLQFIQIDARFYDKDENIVDVGKYIIGDKIPPHSETVQILRFFDLDIDNIDSYTLKVSSVRKV